MAAPLNGYCVFGNRKIPFHFDKWLPYEIPDIVIGINPSPLLLKKLMSANGSRLLCSNWQYKGDTINMYFVPPAGVYVSPVDMWKSKSPNSSSLYPWWCTLAGDNNTPPIDLILQIHPQGNSSEHEHEREPGIAVVERYAPVWFDGKTELWIEGKKPVPLTSQQSIFPKQAHQLVREEPGFSIQLLRMRSFKYRFPSREGHIPCNRLHNTTPTP